MGDELADLGDLVFSIVISYIGALEFLYVVRHLYHWSFSHAAGDTRDTSAEGLKRLQDNMKAQRSEAEAREAAGGVNAMKDGVFYKDGFRIADPHATANATRNDDKRQQELVEEYERQRAIQEETREKLKEAEMELERQRQQATEEAENERKMLEAERQQEEEQRRRDNEEQEAAENSRRLIEVERQREEEQRLRVEEERRREAEEVEAAENSRRLIEAEKQREEEQRLREEEERRREAEELEASENARRLIEAEMQREEEERRREAEEQEAAENVKRLIEAEMQREEEQGSAENLLEAERVREEEQRLLEESDGASSVADLESLIIPEDDLGALAAIIKRKEAEATRELHGADESERRKAEKQRIIEENARKFLEADEKMQQEMQQKGTERLHMRQESLNLEGGLPSPVTEEPCLKRFVDPLTGGGDEVIEGEDGEVQEERCTVQTVKTQFGQATNDQPYAVRTKSLLFPGVSDDGSSYEPGSSAQSSFSTQLSEEIGTGTGSEEPQRSTVTSVVYPQVERQEPEGEDNVPAGHYTDEYLRSLDGIKSRPLVREDGSGRRRAFKKRRSSGSSNSSRDSRTSREEELKMFTSLEEEELVRPSTAKDSADDFTRIKYTSEPTLKVKGHHRRHKRSPAKDMRASDDNLRGSLEMLGEETTNPWGELVPEHYKDTEFWKREKGLSIDEEDGDLEKVPSVEEADSAARADREEHLNMPKTSSFEEATDSQNAEAITALQQRQKSGVVNEDAKEGTEPVNDSNQNLQTSPGTEERKASPSRSSASPRLRRSPRIEEIDQYEVRWREQNPSEPQTPSVVVHGTAEDTAPWRDEYGLVMQGLSDFYDFTASVNPSRSRSTSRQPSPVNSPPSTPGPKSVGSDDGDSGETGKVAADAFHSDNIHGFIEPLSHDPDDDDDNEAYPKTTNNTDPLHPAASMGGADSHDLTYRSSSPLPSALNVERSIESRKTKRIKHNDDIKEKLSHQPSQEHYESSEDIRTPSPRNCLSPMGHSDAVHLNVMGGNEMDADGSRRRSRSKSPLPSAENIERNLEKRRKKLIKRNDEVFEKLRISPPISPETADIRPNQELRVSVSPTMGAPEICVEPCGDTNTAMDDDCSREEMTNLVASLRLARSRSRTRSKSPLPSAENLERNLEMRRKKLIKRNDEVFGRMRISPPISPESTAPISPEIAATRPNPDLGVSVSPTFGAPAICVEPCDDMDDDCSREDMTNLVASLRLARSRSRTRSKSPLPSAENLERNLEMRRKKLIKRNDEAFEKFQMAATESVASTGPTISIEECAEPLDNLRTGDDCSREEMRDLVASLRLARSSRSRSRTPMRRDVSGREPVKTAAEEMAEEHRESRSRTPSRSLSKTPPRKDSGEAEVYPFLERPLTQPNFEYDEDLRHAREIALLSDYYDFHTMLNLEASQNRTLTKNSEELESMMAAKQREVDQEALATLRTASEETELRTVTPLGLDTEKEDSSDFVGKLRVSNDVRRESSPQTDYDRSFSEECRDVQRIKHELQTSGFKRSTYVGESLDFAGGSEYEEMRREAQHFRRSASPSRSLNLSGDYGEQVRQSAAERRTVQDGILNELMAAGAPENGNTAAADEERLGAKPKRSSSSSQETVAARREQEIEEMRREMAEFRRSESRSRSPLDEEQVQQLHDIDVEATRREMQDMFLDEIEHTTRNFQDFSRHLNVNFLDNDRRASDSALIQKPEILIQLRDSDPDFDLDPEEYHHFRRFSLNQEQPVEEYPNDDYVYISQIEVRTPTGTRTWLREDFYSDGSSLDFDSREGLGGLAWEDDRSAEVIYEVAAEEEEEEDDDGDHYVGERPGEFASPPRVDDDYTDGSEDERRTVVEVEDEIDTDICDFNERGPADESHHEQSECEEADREMDQYASRNMDDWRAIEEQVVNEMFDYNRNNNNNGVRENGERRHGGEDETAEGGGAVGGGRPSDDSDSSTIDHIYDDAIRDRKQSGIMRDYDCILADMQQHYMASHASGSQSAGESDTNLSSDSERYALWAKTRHLERGGASSSSSAALTSAALLDSERRDTAMRYLGDATVSARQSTRLRSRYGYVPVLQASTLPEEEVDLNYKPRREYNWRKNFKIDTDPEQAEQQPATNGAQNVVTFAEETTFERAERPDGAEAEHRQFIDLRKYSLGGESITLFSRSPERDDGDAEMMGSQESGLQGDAGLATATNTAEMAGEAAPAAAKPKKKKVKKKKSSRESSLRCDEEDSESQSLAQYSRRSSSIQLDGGGGQEEVSPTKRKTRMRRSSKSSQTSVEDPNGLAAGLSPRPSITEESRGTVEGAVKKKTKRSKRSSKNAAADEAASNDVGMMPQSYIASEGVSARDEASSVGQKSSNESLLPQIREEFDAPARSATPSQEEPPQSGKALQEEPPQGVKAFQEDPPQSVKSFPEETPHSVRTRPEEPPHNVTTPLEDSPKELASTGPTGEAPKSATAIDSFDILKDANFYPLF